MVDFIKITTHHPKKDVVEIFPKFIIGKSNDLMIKGGDFYAIWLEDQGRWSTDEQDVINTIDKELYKFASEFREKYNGYVEIKYMWDSSSGIIDNWHKYCQRQMRDCYTNLDESLVFANQEVNKKDFSTKHLDYSIEEGPMDAYDELMSTLYDPKERHKIEWCIGAIITGYSKTLEKFLVLYGSHGTGKSTMIKIITKLFNGYYTSFSAKDLGSSNAPFAMECLKNNPILAIDYDAKLDKIDDNTRINSIVAHEEITVNEKHKSLYTNKFITFLIAASNNPVKITDSKSGIIRRLIDATPTGNKIPFSTYNKIMKKIDFELGHIAYRCKQIFEENPEYYDNYIPMNMLGETNDFYNFVQDSYILFKRDDQTTLKDAWELYTAYCERAKVPHPLPQREVKAELKSYFTEFFENFQDYKTKSHIRNLYKGFKWQIFDSANNEEADEYRIVEVKEEKLSKHLIFEKQPSKLDEYCKDCPAQYANAAETPTKKWSDVTTKLSDINTSKLHYVKPDLNLIVIDFDLKDETGKKSFKKNLEAAEKWPATYAELSKSGAGIHLHYIYDGDVEQLSRIYDEHIEIKVFNGNSSLRRKLTKCNNYDVVHINSGLPLKGIKKMEDVETIKSEKRLRVLIIRNLNKEIHGATKPSMDFIYKLLDDAYNSGLNYDVSDLYDPILAFAAGSTHNADYCLSLLPKMKFMSDEISPSIDDSDEPLVFFDIEVFPNVVFINYKLEGNGQPMVRLINPKPDDIKSMLKYRLVGFNNRKYDNHILYAIMIGKTVDEVYNISHEIVGGNKKVMFGQAYNLSYTDIYDYSRDKKSLKKWEIDLGLNHLELGLPWDKPVPEEQWHLVSEYCDNDVISTEAVWNATQTDFKARVILADLAGMSVNDTTNTLTIKLIFGNEKHPDLVYTDLSVEFPGYQFIKTWDDSIGKYMKQNMYRGTDVGFGGYVYAEDGIHENVALLDVESMHPHSAIALNIFGKYTKNYKNLVDTRIYIKHKEYSKCYDLFDGKLKKYLTDDSEAKALSNALKLPINEVYGLTSARFDNPCKDPRNENNIVALRGALFMRTLQDEVTSRGFNVIHIKTDSIKIPNATPEIINFCMEFAKNYGYEFEHECTYERMCLVNDAVYIAKYATAEKCNQLYGYAPKENIEEGGLWTATGTQFQVPYVFKYCFSHEPILFEDMCETKQVNTAIYLDFNENLPEDEHDRKFIGRVGLFTPVVNGANGALLLRESKKKDGSIGYDAVVGTKGYRWMESIDVKDKLEDQIDRCYYMDLVNEAIDTISKYGDYEWFASDC